jgi:hypothetical protein
MSGSDGDFDDFLSRRKPLFPRPPDDVLEPPAELDRVVLRQAREAIRAETPEPAYHGTRWGMPVALAASVLVAATLVLHIVSDREPASQVTVQNAAQREYVAETAAAPAAPAAAATPTTSAPTAGAAAPDWRREPRTWLAEIERLRASGETARADAEMAEFKRQNRAFAASPDR